MHEVFVACLIAGTVATLLFAVLGFAGAHTGHLGHAGHGHAGGHGHAAHDAASHPHAGHAQGGHTQSGHQAHSAGAQAHDGWLSAAAGWTLSWFGPLTLAAAAAWFGVVGLLMEGPLGKAAVIVAILAALLGAWIVRSTTGLFVRASTAPLQLTGEGALATVNAAIRADAPGEIIYTLEGLHRSVPARSIDGSAIPRGAAVIVERREGGFAWVRPLDGSAELDLAEGALPTAGSNGAAEADEPGRVVDHSAQ